MNKETINHLVKFVETYYANDVARLYERYPNDQTSLWIDHNDLWRFDSDIASDALEHTDKVTEWLEDAVRAFDVPVDVELSELTVRIHNLPEDKVRPITSLRASDTLGFFGVQGTIEQATKAKEVPETLVWSCASCPAGTAIPQTDPNNLQEPYECDGCERNGPFTVDHSESEFVDEIKLNLKQPADTAPNGQGESIAVVVRADLLEINDRHIQTYTGEKVTINGHIQRRQESKNGKEFVRYLEAHSIDFHNDQETVDVAEHIDEIKEEANKENCIERFAQSLVPQLYETEAWESGLLVAVAYLFGSPRIDLRENDGIDADATFRGDIHAAFIGDPGTMKSGVSRAVHQFAPQSEHRSATGLGSDVGLTATAVDNSDFSDGWTLKPGVLVRANGGHVILEEIDKTSADLEKMNDGLEGNQQITVDKAGINATLDTRVGLLVTGNPEEGRFDERALSEQIDVDRSLLSRFDAILTLEDTPDVDMDTEIAGTIGESYREAAEAEFGGRTDFDVLDRYIDPEVGRAWIKHARETITPVPTREAIEKLQTWYAEEARQLNDSAETVVPATPRKMEVGLRFASAFARVRLSNDLTVKDAEKAIEVQKMLIGQTYDKETGKFNADKHTQGSVVDHGTDEEEYEQLEPRILDAISGEMTTSEIAGAVREEFERVRDALEYMSEKGRIESRGNNRWVQ
jgi:replicative DNA helicase Mcm